MKYCSKCGNEVPDEAVICMGCGCMINNKPAKNAANKTLCTVGMIFSTLILLIPFLFTLKLSFTDYTPFGSSWIGFKNYAYFLNSMTFPRIFLNTIVISILGLIIGAIYVFISSLAISGRKSAAARGLLAVLFAIPAIVPGCLYNCLFTAEIVQNPTFALSLAVACIDGLRVAGLVVPVAFFINNDTLKDSLKCMFLFVAIRLIFIFSCDTEIINSIVSRNAETLKFLDVFQSYLYRSGVTNGISGDAASTHVITALMQVIPAVFGCVLLNSIIKKPSVAGADSGKKNVLPVFAVIIPLFILGAVIVKGGSLLPAFSNVLVVKSYVNSVFVALMSAVLITIMSVFLMLLARNSGVLGIVLTAVLCITGRCISTNFILIHNVGMYNSVLGIVLNNTGMVPLTALIMTFATYNNRSASKDIAAAAVCFVLSFVWFWGDTVSAGTMAVAQNEFPIAVVLKQIMLIPENAGNGILLSTLPFILVPVVVAGGGLIIASCVKGSKSK